MTEGHELWVLVLVLTSFVICGEFQLLSASVSLYVNLDSAFGEDNFENIFSHI